MPRSAHTYRKCSRIKKCRLYIVAFIIGFLENVMNLVGVNPYIQQVIEGFIIVLAVAFDVVSKSKKIAEGHCKKMRKKEEKGLKDHN